MFDLRRRVAPLVCGVVLFAVGCGRSQGIEGTSNQPPPPPPPPPPPATFAVSGTVTGDALEGVAVSLSGTSSASTVTDSSGRFTFGGLANGTYHVQPARAGYAFSPASVSVTVNGADVDAGTFRASAVARTFSISGVVGGPARAGVTLTLEGPTSGSMTTTPDGTYRFGGLVAGDYRITPRKDGFTFSPQSRSVTLSGGDVSGQDFASTPAAATPTWRSVASGTTQILFAVWGTSPDDVWAVGQYGTILHWSGSAWAQSTSGTTSWLWGVWASSATDAWAVGEGGVILHWDGRSWSPSPSPVTGQLRGVWGSGPNDVWAVGSLKVLHWDGTAWTASPAAGGLEVTGVWGTSTSDVWAVGDGTLHWNGATWTRTPSNNPFIRHSAWGSSPTAVWAVGESTIDLWNGSSWSVSREDPHADYQGVWGSADDDAWVVGEWPHSLLHWDGRRWSDAPNPTAGIFDFSLRALWGSSATDVWAVGDNGTILRYSP